MISSAGSSPRMRGTLQILRGRHRDRRFIPAHAGNTCNRPCSTGTAPVHPRACGEHWYFSSNYDVDSGSSPRMRGTLGLRLGDALLRRFIPAHAGNTAVLAPTCPFRAVHPRACGEHDGDGGDGDHRDGSSPRMRGTHVHDHAGGDVARFIPAHAGNTKAREFALRAKTVHPRACGEHAIGSQTMSLAGGSSPRMRGTRLRSRRGIRPPRFIPAHAGNTS